MSFPSILKYAPSLPAKIQTLFVVVVVITLYSEAWGKVVEVLSALCRADLTDLLSLREVQTLDDAFKALVTWFTQCMYLLLDLLPTIHVKPTLSQQSSCHLAWPLLLAFLLPTLS